MQDLLLSLNVVQFSSGDDHDDFHHVVLARKWTKCTKNYFGLIKGLMEQSSFTNQSIASAKETTGKLLSISVGLISQLTDCVSVIAT